MANKPNKNVFIDEIKYIDPYNLPLADIKGPIERKYKFRASR